MSIAGFDPSAGAGILADIKAMEQSQVYGLGVITANTVQTDNVFEKPNWIPFTQITAQLELLLQTYPINYCKIGLIKNLSQLDKIITILRKYRPKIKIVWDPILSASAGFEFHPKLDEDLLIEILDRCYLITPNIPEFKRLCFGKENQLNYYRALCNVLIKGGHSDSAVSTDILYLDAEEFSFSDPKEELTEKHGTGCILSSLITAELAKYHDIVKACENAKSYTLSVIKSNDTALGYHFL